MTRELTHPFSAEATQSLALGEKVRISGTLFTGRDRLHKYLYEGGECPVDLRNGALYHCGPVVLQRDGVWAVTAAGPTTSVRHEPYMATLIARHGLRVVLGKGGMGEATRKACAEHGCVYLHAVGGASALIAACVESVKAVHFIRDFGAAEALWVLQVRGIEAVVTIDAHGHSLHDEVMAKSKVVFEELIRRC
jgi:tartrate/fumarate subfamily iron-sulfur-dependent hydro-lyase beta chain